MYSTCTDDCGWTYFSLIGRTVLVDDPVPLDIAGLLDGANQALEWLWKQDFTQGKQGKALADIDIKHHFEEIKDVFGKLRVLAYSRPVWESCHWNSGLDWIICKKHFGTQLWQLM